MPTPWRSLYLPVQTSHIPRLCPAGFFYGFVRRFMQTALDSAHSWFLDSMAQGLNGVLVVRLVDGIRGIERKFVEVGETKLGPYFPVQVEAVSRCAEVQFPNAIAFFTYNESYDAPDPELKKDNGHFLFVAEASSFRRFVEARTSVAQLHQGPYQEFLLRCEDCIIHVLSSEAPVIDFLAEQPNLNVERTNTWSAN